jgi:hypothetical protein
MKRITLGLAAGLCAAFATAAPALADNTATGSTGVVQIGSVTANPTATVGAGTTTATVAAPVRIGRGGHNTAHNSNGVAQVGGGNTASNSNGAAQVGGIETAPSANVTAGGTSATLRVPAGIFGSGNSATNTTGAAQIGGGNDASGSTGTVQSGGPAANPSLTSGDTTASAPFAIGGDGSNAATGSTGVVQIGGGNGSTGSTGVLQTGTVLFGGGEPGSGVPGSSESAIASLLGSPAAGTSAPAPVQNQGLLGDSAQVAAQGARVPAIVAGAARVLRQSIVAAGGLPFTGLALLLWVLIGLTSLTAGAGLRSRRVALG